MNYVQTRRFVCCTVTLAAIFAASIAALAQEAFPPATPESQGLSANGLRQLRDVVQSYADDDMIVGGELLVIKNRRTVLHDYVGLKDRDPETRWNAGTICNIRSMSKTLTGAAAQILIDRGELSLDDKVSKYLPGFDTDESREITVEHLITHQSGLPLTILTTGVDQYDNLQDQANAAGERGPQFPPGSKFWYSDAGSDALGAIVETISGKLLNEFVQEELLTPLGMTDSFYCLDADDERFGRIASLYIGSPKNWIRFWTAADGKALYPFAWGSQTIYGTPKDYAKFLAMWVDGGKIGDKQLLSEEAVKRTLTPVSPMTMLGSDGRFPTSYKGLEVWYGQMSVLHIPEGGGASSTAQIIGHSGSDGTIAWAWPEEDLMVLFYTQSRGGAAVLRLEKEVDRLFVHPELYADAADVPAEIQPLLGTYIADFATLNKEELEVRYDDGKLVLDIPSQMAFELKEADEAGKWSFVAVPEITIWFERERGGRFDLLKMNQSGMIFDVPRKGTALAAEIAEASKLKRADVEKYLGTYAADGDENSMTIVFHNDGLGFTTTAIEDMTFALWPVPGQNVWLVRQNGVTVLRFKEDDGKVIAVDQITGQDVMTLNRVGDGS